jgi:hypothetical protein
MTAGEHALPHVSAAGSIGKTAKIPKTDMLTRVNTNTVALNRRAKYFNILYISLNSQVKLFFVKLRAASIAETARNHYELLTLINFIKLMRINWY